MGGPGRLGGAAGGELVGAEAVLRAQAVDPAIGEPGRAVEKGVGGIDALDESVGGVELAGDDRVGVF